MSNTSIENQINLFNNLKNNLNGFTDSLKAEAEKYTNSVDSLYQEGIFKEFYNNYSADYLEETVSNINDIINSIQENDIVAINDVITKLEDLI